LLDAAVGSAFGSRKSLHSGPRSVGERRFERVDRAVRELSTGVRAWISGWNESPRPYVCTNRIWRRSWSVWLPDLMTCRPEAVLAGLQGGVDAGCHY
jgi:hypothetical protein